MRKPTKMAMPKKAAKAAGGPATKEKANHGKRKGTGVNALMKQEPVPQIKATTTYGQPKPTQKL